MDNVRFGEEKIEGKAVPRLESHLSCLASNISRKLRHRIRIVRPAGGVGSWQLWNEQRHRVPPAARNPITRPRVAEISIEFSWERRGT